VKKKEESPMFEVKGRSRRRRGGTSHHPARPCTTPYNYW